MGEKKNKVEIERLKRIGKGKEKTKKQTIEKKRLKWREKEKK